MAFMQLQITQAGALYSCDCARCGSTLFTHEWVHDDHNERRDAMEAGTLACDHCGLGHADKETFLQHKRKEYAGRYSAPGYMDCTEWDYDANKRTLTRRLRTMHGEE